MMESKIKRIVHYLFEHRERYVTSQELAEELEVSDRTIRNYIKQLMSNIAKQDGITLISKQGYGYRLDIKQEGLIYLAQEQVLDNKGHLEEESRVHYIINKLLFEPSGVLLEDLAEDLYLSRSSLAADMRKIREKFTQYHLTVESRANKGMYVTGEEQDIRRFMVDYFFSDFFLKHFQQYIGKSIIDIPVDLEAITLLVLDSCRKEGLLLSDYVIQNLVIHIALAVKRMQEGFPIESIKIEVERYTKEWKVANRIVDQLFYQEGITLPNEELAYIALHLISKGHPNLIEELQNHLLQEEMQKAFAKVDKDYGTHFSSDQTLLESLSTHFEILKERLSNRIHLTNPLVADIQEQYGEMLDLTRLFLNNMPSFEKEYISIDELAYITLHLMASFERDKELRRANVLVICATGFGSAQMLKHRIQNELGRYVTVEKVIGYYELVDYPLENIDLIISSIDLSTLVFPVPIIHVSVFLKEEDVTRVKEAIKSIQYRQVKVDKNDNLELDTIIDLYFSKELFFVFESIEKENLMHFLSEKLADGRKEFIPAFLDLMEQREKLSTVIFDKDIAVPHPLKALDSQHKIAVAIIKNGVMWDTDFKEIKIVFLVSPSIYENEGLAELTNRIVELTDRQDLKQAIIAADDYASFKEIFLS